MSTGKIILVGDSRTVDEGVVEGNDSVYLSSRGPLSWFLALAGNPLELFHFAEQGSNNQDEGSIIGSNNYTTQDIVTNFKREVLDKEPSLVVLQIGTNDIESNIPVSTIASNIKTIVEMANAANAQVWVANIDPRNPTADNTSSNAFTEAQELTRTQLNNWLSRYCYSNQGCTLLDYASVLSHSSNSSVLLSEYTTDGKHWTSSAAFELAKRVWVPAWMKLNSLIRAERVYSVPSLYNASTNIYGNLLANADFNGIQGVAGTDIVGIIPDNFKIERTVGSTVTASSVISNTFAPVSRFNGSAELDSINKNIIALTTISNGQGDNLETITLSGNDTAQAVTGKIDIGVEDSGWYEAQIEVHVPANYTSRIIRSIYLELTDEDDTTDQVTRHFNTAYTDTDQTPNIQDHYPNNSHKLILRTPALRVNGSETSLSFKLHIETDGSKQGSDTIFVLNPVLKKLPNIPSATYKSRLFIEDLDDNPRTLAVETTSLVLGDSYD